MNIPNDYLNTNKDSWNKRTEYHIKSDFYNMTAFMRGESSLNEIELKLLGDVKGKSILHLQCHFGQDTLSLARLGAKATGVDFSDKAIENARELNSELRLDAKFVCCDIYNLRDYINEKYDIVFTSYGVIGWLPDLDRWAKLISNFLKPGGRFIMVEFHPVVWMFDDNFEKIKYSYFNAETIIEKYEGTYADKNAPMQYEIVTWNHSLSDVLNSLLENGIIVNEFYEYDYSPYDCFNQTIKVGDDKYRIKHLDNKIPMIFSLLATNQDFFKINY